MVRIWGYRNWLLRFSLNVSANNTIVFSILLSQFTVNTLWVRAHRKRAAAAGSDLCPRRESVRTVLCKTASSPSNIRRADAADQSRSWRAADICVLETGLPGGQYGMAGEFTEKLIEKVREYVFLYDTVIFAQAFPLLVDFVHPSPSPFSFTTQC